MFIIEMVVPASPRTRDATAAGKAQKDPVRKGLFFGSITQDPHQIGFKAVELACKAFKGEPVSNVDTGVKFYDKSNMD